MIVCNYFIFLAMQYFLLYIFDIYRIDFIKVSFIPKFYLLGFSIFRLMCRSDTEAKNMIAVEYKQSNTGEKNSKH